MYIHPQLGIRIDHKKVGSQHVFTSPDLPGLYVAHADRDIAERSIPSAVELLRRMQDRQDERERVRKRTVLV